MPDGTAIIADPRNDENVIICGPAVGVPPFHNQAVDHVRGARPQ